MDDWVPVAKVALLLEQVASSSLEVTCLSPGHCITLLATKLFLLEQKGCDLGRAVIHSGSGSGCMSPMTTDSLMLNSGSHLGLPLNYFDR